MLPQIIVALASPAVGRFAERYGRRIVLMTPRPGRIDHEIASPLMPGPEARIDAAYAAMVAQVSREMARALAA